MATAKVGFIQMNIKFGDKKTNIRRGLELSSRICDSDLIVFPELFNVGYTFTSKEEVQRLAEGVDGLTVKRLSRFSREYSLCIVAGFAEKEGNRLFNSAAIIHDGDLIGVYRKAHLFYLEKRWFDPGDSGFPVFKIGKFKLGVMICFDWAFPEVVRSLALRGAQVIAHPSNLIYPYALTVMLARSIENRIYTITADRVGQEPRGGYTFRFKGQSQITSPDMKVIFRAPEGREIAFAVEIDLDKAVNKRITEFNDLFRDRRTDLYRLQPGDDISS